MRRFFRLFLVVLGMIVTPTVYCFADAIHAVEGCMVEEQNLLKGDVFYITKDATEDEEIKTAVVGIGSEQADHTIAGFCANGTVASSTEQIDERTITVKLSCEGHENGNYNSKGFARLTFVEDSLTDVYVLGQRGWFGGIFYAKDFELSCTGLSVAQTF